MSRLALGNSSSYSIGDGSLLPGEKQMQCEDGHLLPLAPRLRLSGVTPLTALLAFKAWTIFPFYLISQNQISEHP